MHHSPEILPEEKWETLQDIIHRITLAIFGKKTSKLHNLYEAKLSEMTPLLRQSMPHSPSTSGHPPSRTYRLSGLPGARSNASPGTVPMSTGQSTVR